MRHTRKKKARTKLLSVKVPVHVSAKVTKLAHERGTTLSEVVRDALDRYDGGVAGSFADAASNYIGSLSGGPGDLATNPVHLKDFGRWKR